MDDTTSVDDLIDAMLRENAQNDLSSSGPMVAPQAAPAQAPAGQAPSILDLLSKTATPPPALPGPAKDDTNSILPLTLLRFAASVTRPRVHGQNALNAILGSASDAAGFASTLKAEAQQKAVAAEEARRKMALQDAQLQEARLGSLSRAQGIQDEAARAPLELEKLRDSVAGAKTTQELANIQLRIAKVSEKYADQKAQAELNERNAKSEHERAQAAAEAARAALYATQSKELLEVAKLRASGANKASYQLKEGMPGEPSTVLEQRSGAVYQAPMSRQDALSYAKREVAAMKEMGEVSDSKTERQKLNEIYTKAVAGTLPQTQAAPGASPAGSSGASATPPAKPSAAAPSSAETAAMKNSAEDPRGVWTADTDMGTKYYIAGKEVDRATAQARMAKPAASPAAAPASAPPPAAGASPADRIGAQLDAAKAALSAVGMPPGAKAIAANPNALIQWRANRDRLVSQIRNLELQYRQAVGNPGAYFGR